MERDKKRESVVRIRLDRSEAGRQNKDEAEDAEEAGILSAGKIWLSQRGSIPGWKGGGGDFKISVPPGWLHLKPCQE